MLRLPAAWFAFLCFVAMTPAQQAVAKYEALRAQQVSISPLPQEASTQSMAVCMTLQLEPHSVQI
jgi:hypothetical protein